MEVAGARNRKTWNECVEDDMKVLGLHADLQGMWIVGYRQILTLA